jgi:O-antigen ligase
MEETFAVPVEQQIRYYLYQLASPLGVTAAVCFLVALVLITWVDWAKWVALSLLIYLQTFGFVFRIKGAEPVNVLVTPLQQIRNVGRPLALALICLLLVPTFRSLRGGRWRLIHSGTIVFVCFEFLLALRFIVGDNYNKGVLALIVYGLYFLVLGVGLSRWLQGPKEAHIAVKTIVVGGGLMVLSTLCQFVAAPSAAYNGDRLAGTTNNPQHLGSTLAICIPAAAYLLVRKGESIFWRMACGCLLGFGLIVLMGTGSRLGLLMTLIGLLLLFRHRLGRFAVMGVVVSVVAYIALWLLGVGAITGADHLLDTRNSRAEGWQRTWEVFMNNFWFGTGSDADMIENSFLSAGSETGMLGLAVMLAATALVVAGLWRLTRIRRSLGENAMLADLVCAIIVSILVGSFFEAFLMSSMTDMLVILYISLGLMALMIDPGPPVGEISPEMIDGDTQGAGAAEAWPTELAPVGGDSYHHGNGYGG